MNIDLHGIKTVQEEEVINLCPAGGRNILKTNNSIITEPKIGQDSLSMNRNQ